MSAASTSSSVPPSASQSANSFEPLRRRLEVELIEMRGKISKANRNNPLIQKIDGWQKDFRIALSKEGDVKPILDSYLERLRAEGLEKIYIALTSKTERQAETPAARIERLRERTLHLDQVDRQRRRAEMGKVDDEIRASFRRRQQMAAGLMQNLDEVIAADKRDAKTLEDQLLQLREKERVQRKGVAQDLNGMGAKWSGNFKVEQERLYTFEEKRASFDVLKFQLASILEQTIEPLEDRICNFTASSLKELEEFAECTQDELEHLEALVQKLQEDLSAIKTHSEHLKELQRQVSEQIGIAWQEEQILERRIEETKVAVEEMKERASSNCFLECGLILGCVILTVASSGAFAAVPVSNGTGAMLNIGFAI